MRRITLALAVALALAIALSAAACGGSPAAKKTAVVRASTATPRPSPTPLPPRRALLAGGGIGVIEVAYNRIVDEHVTPVDEAALLSAAWAGVQTAAAVGRFPQPPSPAFTGDRAVDIARFRDAWLALPPELRDFPPTRWTAISSMARSLNDCHTYFIGPSLDPSAGDIPQDRTLSGFGMTLTGRPPIVAEVETEPFSPAAVAGIQTGDTIVSIDGEDTTGKAPLDVLILLDGGEEGSNADIRVRRPGVSGAVSVTLNRSAYTPANLQTQVRPDGIGYIRIHEWSTRVTKQLRDAIARFDKGNVKKWIIDLRGNPGGVAGADAISLFVPDGVIVRARQRDGSVVDERASGDVLPALKPLDILVDDGSASMSEIFALALKEYGVAHLVGMKTYGCIGGTFVDDIGDGSGLAVTFETMLGPVTGAGLNGIGISPDETVVRTADDIIAGRDPQLDAAVADLSGQ